MSYELVLYRWDLAAKEIVRGSMIIKEYKRFNNALKVAMKVAEQARDIFDLPADIPEEFRPTTVMECVINATYQGCTEPRRVVCIAPEHYVDDNEVRGIKLTFKVGDKQWYDMDYYNPIKNNEQFQIFYKKYERFLQERDIKRG